MRHREALTTLLEHCCQHRGGQQGRPGVLILMEGEQAKIWSHRGLDNFVLERLHHILPHRLEDMLEDCQRQGGSCVQEHSSHRWWISPLREPQFTLDELGSPWQTWRHEDGTLLGVIMLQLDGEESSEHEEVDDPTAHLRNACLLAGSILTHEAYRGQLGWLKHKLHDRDDESRSLLFRARRMRGERDTFRTQLRSTEGERDTFRAQLRCIKRERDTDRAQLRSIQDYLGADNPEDILPILSTVVASNGGGISESQLQHAALSNPNGTNEQDRLGQTFQPRDLHLDQSTKLE